MKRTSRFDPSIIFTRADGTVIPRPVLKEDHNAEDRANHMRALHDYNDAVTDAANSAFDSAFRKALKEEDDQWERHLKEYP